MSIVGKLAVRRGENPRALILSVAAGRGTNEPEKGWSFVAGGRDWRFHCLFADGVEQSLPFYGENRIKDLLLIVLIMKRKGE